MANRAASNTVIIDATGSLSDVLAPDAEIVSICFFAVDTTSKLELYVGSTADVIIRLQSPDGNPMPVSQYLGGFSAGDLGVKTLTAGTGVIYLR